MHFPPYIDFKTQILKFDAKIKYCFLSLSYRFRSFPPPFSSLVLGSIATLVQSYKHRRTPIQTLHSRTSTVVVIYIVPKLYSAFIAFGSGLSVLLSDLSRLKRLFSFRPPGVTSFSSCFFRPALFLASLFSRIRSRSLDVLRLLNM